jgi:hypothetical protein
MHGLTFRKLIVTLPTIRPRVRALRQRDRCAFANSTIIEGRDASQYPIGIVSARIAEMVLRQASTAMT